MAIEFNGTTSYIEATSAVLTAVPITIAAWFYPDVNNVAGTIVGITASGATNARFTLQQQSTGPIRAAVQAGGTTAGADSSISTTTGTWQHGCAVFTGNSNRTVYLNGGYSGNNTTSITPSAAALNRTNIGTQWRNQARENFFDGRVAEVGIWNVALTADEIVALYQGHPPSSIRPQSLRFYAPSIREVIDVRNGLSLSLTSTTVIEHPRRIG